MNLSAIYSKSGKGARALASKSKSVPVHALRILPYIDGKTTAGAVFAQLSKISEDKFSEAMIFLASEGYIKEISEDYLSQSLSDFDIHTPIVVAEISAEEFMQIESEAENADHATTQREKAEADARAHAYAEQQRKQQQEALEQEEAERRLLNVTDILAKSSEALDIERLAANEPRLSAAEAEAKARARHKARKRKLAEEARHVAEQLELAETKAQAASEATLAAEAEAREKREREEKLEQAIQLAEQKSKQELDAQAKRETEAAAALQAKQAAEALAIDQAKQLALETEARQAAELAAEKAAQAQIERLAKLKAEQDAKEAAETHARQQAAERAQREAEKQARIAAEKQAKAERKAQEEALARAEREAKLKRKAEQQAQREAENKQRAEAKALARREAEQQARAAAEIKAQHKAEREQLLQEQRKLKEHAKREAKRQAAEAALAKAEERAQYKAAQPAISYSTSLQNAYQASKIGLICMGVAILVLLIVLPFINLGFLIAPTERIATRSMAEPVTINTINVSLWPRPHFVIEGVSVGSLSDIKIGTVEAYPVLSTLNDDVILVENVKVQTLKLDEITVQRLWSWLKNINRTPSLRIANLSFDNAALTWQGMTLPSMTSKIMFNQTGKIQKAVLANEAGNLKISVIPADYGYALDINADAWQFPVGLPVKFDTLKATGRLAGNQLELEQIEGQLYNGTLRASSKIQWPDAWVVDGKFELAGVDLTSAATDFPDLVASGQMDMNAAFFLQAAELSGLLDNTALEAQFSVTNGKLEGIDLIRAIHANGKKSINGVTPFDQLAGNMALRNEHYQFRNLSLKANQLQAYGEVDVFANKDISGRLDIKLAVKSRPLQSRIQLSGNTTQPSMK